MTPLDRLLAFRTLRIELLLALLALIVGAATDEATATWADRLTRLAALLPLLGAAAVSIVVTQLQRRGELTALHLVGASPSRSVMGALIAAASIGQIGAIAIASGLPLGSLFPVSKVAGWSRSDGAFTLPTHGLTILDSGELLTTDVIANPSLPFPRLATVIAIAAMSAVTPWWATLKCGLIERAAVASTTLALLILTFHVAATGQGAWSLLAAPFLLCAHGWMRVRLARVMFAR